MLLAFMVAPPLSAAPLPAAAGITEPFLDVVLSPSVPGLVSRRHFQEGDAVKEGQVIVELDKRLEELAVARRQLVMDASKHELDDLRTLARSSKGVSQDEVDKAELDYQLAVVDHAAAVEQLSRRLIKAPFSGAITEYYFDVGEAVEAYQPLLRLVDTRRCYFIANVEAAAATGLKLDQPVRLQIDTAPRRIEVKGKIVYLAPVVDPASGLLKVKAGFDNRDAKLRPGLAGRMFFD